MLLGILSDTHGYYHPELDTALADVDLILHAGDVGDEGILDRLGKIAPTHGVWGNIDGSPVRTRLPEHEHLEAAGVRIWMTHIGGNPGRWAPGIGAMLRRRRPDVFVCGHSHILRIERVSTLGGMVFINPGAAGRQGFHQVKTCVRLLVENGSAHRAEVVHLEP